jgi:Ca2+:H+ antiporter
LIKSFILGTVLFSLACEVGGGFLAGGIRSNASLPILPRVLALSSVGLLALGVLCVPVAFVGLQKNDGAGEGAITNLSHGIAFILLIIYLTWMFFHLKSHAELFEDSESEGGPSEDATISSPAAILGLIIAAVLYAICGKYLVSSIAPVIKTQRISGGFIGFILLPMTLNASACLACVVVAGKRKLDLALEVVFAAVLEVVCFATPVLVILGWIIKEPMDLDFEVRQVALVAPLAIVICLMLQNGQIYYLHGVIIIGM